ncbi:hypothetical protein FRC09_013341 [Ceratobasidium sp. 395]|nr:hypothetical protein FRC09_013341 [Ceratobasidium sp. 395]
MIFKELMTRIYAVGERQRICRVCKIMAGTGTGALIACMLVLLELNVDQAIAAYLKLVKAVFLGKKLLSTSGSGTFKAGVLEEELKKMVREAKGNEDTLIMGEQRDEDDCKVMVFAMSEHNMNASTPRIFRSYQGLANQMPNCPIWQVLRATMAHPELFKSFQIGKTSGVQERLVGGDTACSNPIRHVLAEFSALYPKLHVASIVCIGAGHARTIHIPKLNPLHRLMLMPMNVLEAMKNIATDSEREAQDMAVRFQSTVDVYFRFNVDQGMQDAQMSKWQEENQVAAHTRTYMQKAEVNRQIDKAARTIADRKGVLVGADIGGAVRQPTVQQTTGVKRCPAPSPAFTGCERQIAQVVTCLLGHNNERRVCVVHGLGGSGKTQIALKSVERTRNKWSDIVYVDATTRESAIATLTGFALARGIGKTHEDALQWLELSSQSWLLVIDNADDPDLGLQKYIPGGSHGSVVVTTRLRTLALLGQGPGSDCGVGQMESEDAIELLLTKARMKDDVLSREERESAAKLVEDLGYLALAVVHAGAYIFCSKTSIEKYRKQCLDNAQASLERYSKLAGNTEEYEKTVYTTWVMSYERLKPQTQQILGLMAYLHHGGITEDIFRRAAHHIDRTPVIPPNDDELATRQYVRDSLTPFLDTDGSWDSNAFSAIMDELLLYSLIDYDRVNQAFALHVLVQDWSCTMIPHSKTTALMHTSHLVALSINYSNALETHTYLRGLLVHVSKVLMKLDTSNINDAWHFAIVYWENGRWKEVEALQVRVLDARKQTLGELHPDTLTTMNNLANTYMDQGRWDEAEALEVRVLDAMKQTLGELHPDTLMCMANLASTYSNQGRWDEAEALEVRVLDASKQTQGELHPDTLTSMNNLASTYSNQGRWDEAETLQVRVLDGRKQILGELHPRTLTSMNNLAWTYSDQGRWDEAEALQVQVLDARKQTLGELHPDTLTSMASLANTYLDQGRWDEAEALEVRVLDGRKQTQGELHPDTLEGMHSLASTYRRQGRWDEAEALLMRVLDARKQTQGELHPDTLASMHSLASTYWNRGRWDEAEALQVQVLDARKQALGELHPDTLASMNNLANTYRDQGRWNEAEALHVQVLDARKQTCGELHPNTLTTMNNLANTYRDQGRWNEAEALHVQVLDARKQTCGELHPNTLTTMNNLANTYRDQGRWNEAEALQAQVVDAMKQTLGELHPDTLTCMGNLANTYRDQGRWNEAEALHVQVLDARKQTCGELHPETLGSMSNLASTYAMQGRLDEAEALEVRVLDARKQACGELHPETLTSKYSLAWTYHRQGRWDEAEALQIQTVAANKQVFGEQHRETLEAMELLAGIRKSRQPQHMQKLSSWLRWK